MDDDKSQAVINPNEDEELELQDEAQEEVQDDSVEQDTQEEELDQQDEQPEEEEERKPSRREQLRINNLLQKYGNPYERQEPQQQQRQDSGVNYREMIEADDDVYNQLDQASRQYGEQRYNQGMQEQKKELDKLRFEQRLEVDAPRVESRYPQLDKNSDEFNPAVADSLNQMYLSTVGYDSRSGYVANPNLRYSEYIDAMFELVNEAASRQTETTRRNVTRQAARTGLRPDGSTPAATLNLNKDPSEMTDKELNAVINRNLGIASKPRR